MPPRAPKPAQRPREPSIRQKANHAFFVRWGGKDHYLSTDLATAQQLFFAPDSTHPGSRTAWLRWKHTKARHAELLAQTSAPRNCQRTPGRTPGRPHPNTRTRRPLLIIDILRELLDSYLAAGRPGAAHYFQSHLARFIDIHGEAPLIALTTADPASGVFQPPIIPLINTFRRELQAVHTMVDGRRIPKFKPKTINHDLTAIKRLFTYAAEQGHCPHISFKGVRKLPVQRDEPEDLRPLELFRLFALVHRTEPLLLPYMALNYLTLARPSEVVELVMQTRGHLSGSLPFPHHRRRARPARPPHARPGRFLPITDAHSGAVLEPRGLFSLGLHKNSWRDDGSSPEGPSRFLVLTDQALIWLDQALPVWSTLDSYSSAVARAAPGFGPRMLRDSAASHLRQQGAALEDVQILLGHAPRGEWPSYARTPWRGLRDLAARIAL